ncbi:unnamed protein product [Tilletia controversa]|uniref:Uncharacterized protein n=3 Tax=Tilletia TaxID=13289 RepID=A0A8X7N0Y0_9BASI|nr:hypothetical protein CF336_g135 [Tilletia laevis]KAE8206108.1 hypothetical protein CF328_g116 [Tilletia controversa]KAE8265680.1 hypothetical protein A4X03_0g96 [Tilletia caries]KAE8255813.1 hypothetical protein A4X06_0g249 [Tilletia controversa]CAD6899902.1 unnamed protein product [Tilletia caries]
MSGHQPRPLPPMPMPMPGSLRPGGQPTHHEEEQQNLHHRQQQLHPWAGHHLPPTSAPHSSSSQWTNQPQQMLPTPDAWSVAPWPAQTQTSTQNQEQPWASSAAAAQATATAAATAGPPVPYPQTEAARPDPFALMTFQSDPGNFTPSHPGQRPPLPVPPTLAHNNSHSSTSASTPTAAQPGAGGRSDAAWLPPSGAGFGTNPNAPPGWNVEPAHGNVLPQAHRPSHGHGPLPHPPQQPSAHAGTTAVQSPAIAGLSTSTSASSSPKSRPGSSYMSSADPSARPSHRSSGSGPVHNLAQQLATSNLHQGANGSGNGADSTEFVPIAPYSNSADQWISPYGRHEMVEEPSRIQSGDSAIQDYQHRSFGPGDIFPMSASNSSASIPTSSTLAPTGWTVTSFGSTQIDGSLAPPRSSTSASAEDPSNGADDDDSRSILSLGSRRAAFSRDLADPNFIANMAIIARDVPLREHAKGSLVYPESFTGKDLVSTLQAVIPAELFINPQEPTSDEQQSHYARLAAAQVADALREQNLFHEVEWEQGEVVDGDDALYAFSDEMVVRIGAAPRRPSSFYSATQTGESESADEPTGEETDRGESSSRDAHAPFKPRQNYRNAQRSKTLPWQDTITPELRSKLSKYEIQRQNTILEAIEHEQQFLADLELLQNLFVDGLKAKSVIAAHEHDDFVKVVFGNHRQLASHIRGLVEELHVRQAEQHPIVRSVGDLFLNAALSWREEYCAAIANYPFAANRVQKEVLKNPAFDTFLKECRRDPRSQRHELTTFLYRPVVRLQRYQLYFKAIMDAIKKSREASESSGRLDNESKVEHDALNTVNGVIHIQVEDAQRDLVTSQYKVDIANFAEAFAATSKRSEFEVDMDLRNPERQLKHRGKVLLDGVEMLAILFDNYFVLAKEPKTLGEQTQGPQRLALAKRPIPVELLETSGFNGQPVSTTLAIFRHLSSRKVSRQVWSFSVSHSHGRSESFTLTVSEESTRREWQGKFEEACTMRRIVQENVKAWTVSTLNDEVFAIPKSTSSAADAARDPGMKGAVSCTSLFNVVLEGQRRPCIAVGTDQGVFIGPRHSASIQKVLSLRNVSQIAIMDQLDLMFVLADKVLRVCRLVDLFLRPQNVSGFGSAPTLQQISSLEEEVMFFSVGILESVNVVVYAKKKPNDRGTGFVILETMFDPGWSMRIPFRGVNGGPQFKAFGSGRFEYKADVFSLQFRRKGLSLCTANGFELCNIGRNESCAYLPVPAPPAKDDVKGQALQKRMKNAKPMALFKISDTEFLLCFNTFGCFVTPERIIARDGAVIEWETEPISFVYRKPYLLAVDPRFVEIRTFSDVTVSTANEPVKALSGRLLQFFRAEQMRLLNTQANDSVDLMPPFDSPQTSSNALTAGANQRDPALDAIVLGAMKRPKSGVRGARAFQAIVEVVPDQYANKRPAARNQWP